MDQIKIVRGNDFLLKINVSRELLDGTTEEAMNLEDVDNLRIRLVAHGHYFELPHFLGTATGVVYARCVNIPIGTYALQVSGVYNKNAVCSFELKIVTIVLNNAKGNVTAEMYEGEPSYQIDTTLKLYTGVALEISDKVEEGDTNAVTSGAVYNELEADITNLRSIQSQAEEAMEDANEALYGENSVVALTVETQEGDEFWSAELTANYLLKITGFNTHVEYKFYQLRAEGKASYITPTITEVMSRDILLSRGGTGGGIDTTITGIKVISTSAAYITALKAVYMGGGLTKALDTAAADHTQAAKDHVTAVSDSELAQQELVNMQSLEETVENNETTRNNQETTRQSQESTRQSNEVARVGAERTRNAAETARQSAENTRITNENSRVNSETIRQTQETTRQSNESTRETNETTRIRQEDIRVSAEAERSSEERNRINSEEDRQRAEDTRVANEGTRQTNETTRQNNETSRTTTFNSDHTTATNDHTQAGTDHTQAGEDHTQYLADHAIVEGYDERLTTDEAEVAQIALEVGSKGEDVILNATVGSNIYSNNNIYNGEELPAGTIIKFKVNFTNGCLTKLRVVCGSLWSNLIAETDVVDGQEFVKSLPIDANCFGLYVAGTSIVADGMITINYQTAYGESLEYKITKNAEDISTNAEDISTNAEDISTNAEDIKKINPKILYRPDSEPTSANTAWLLDIYLQTGKTYLVRWLSGDRGNLGVGSDYINLSRDKRWHEFTPSTSGQAFSYIGTCDTKPVIEIADKNGVGAELIPNVVKGVNETTHWIFSGYTFIEGATYYVKHISGDIGRLNIGSKTGIRLVNGEWVEYEALATGEGYFFMTPSSQPTIEIVDSDSLLYNIIKNEIEITKKQDIPSVTTIKVSRTDSSAQFSGLNAIADAINSISDASETHRYRILVDGHFHYTDPSQLTMIGGDELSAIYMKDFVDIEGINGASIFVDLNQAFAYETGGKTYANVDMQPVYFNVEAKLSNLKIFGKNCRYCLHLENVNDPINKDHYIENCYILHYGNIYSRKDCIPDTTAEDKDNRYGDTLGTGQTDGQTWYFKNCTFAKADGTTCFACHTPLNRGLARDSWIFFENCNFEGDIALHNYQIEHKLFVSMVGCHINKGVVPSVVFPYYYRTFNKSADYTTINLNANDVKALYYAQNTKGKALRVISATTGTTSVVRFDKTSSAFDSVISDNDENGRTQYEWEMTDGYVYRDGGVDLSGQAFGILDLDSNAGNGHSLGKNLGDCSTTNKVLVISVDGTDYSVTFNKDYTSIDNDTILAEINAVLGSNATADLFSPCELYYPNINELNVVKSVDDGAILKGMGIIITNTGMRRAKNSDGYIDGICIDDTSNGQFGRVIKGGYIATAKTVSDYTQWGWFLIGAKDNFQSSSFSSASCGISSETDGEFDINASPKVLRQANEMAWKIL